MLFLLLNINFYYNQVKSIIERQNDPRFKLYHSLELFIILLSIARLTNIIVAAHLWPGAFNQRDWDPHVHEVHQYAQYLDPYFLASGILFAIHILVIQLALYFGQKTTVSTLGYYDLVVTSTEIYQKSLRSKDEIVLLIQDKVKHIKGFLGKWFPKPLVSLSGLDWLYYHGAQCWMLFHLDHVNMAKMDKYRLKIYKTLSLEVRVRLLVITFAFDAMFLSTCMGYLIVMPVSLSIMWYLAMRGFTLWHGIFVVCDIFLTVSMAIVLARDTLFIFHYTYVMAEVTRMHVREGNRMVAEMVRRSQQRQAHSRFRTRSQITPFDMIQLAPFYHEHTQMTTRISVINHDFIGSITFILLGLHIPVNIILAHRMVFLFKMQLISFDYIASPLEPLITLLTMVLQAGVFASVLIPMARSNGEFERTAKHLPNLIPLIGRDALALKMKLEDLYGRLMGGNIKIGSTIGPKKTITYNALFELLLLYFGYLLCMFSFLMERQRQMYSSQRQ